MLCKFKVKNFKNFKDWFSFDLSETKNYDFNKECINDGIVSKALIYGPNACGKSNLGNAIFNLQTHLTDKNINQDIYSNYLNAETDNDLAEFIFVFKFNNIFLEYKYGKTKVNELVYETLLIDGKEEISLDRRNNEKAIVNLKGSETLNLDLTNPEISIIKYVKNNVILENNKTNDIFKLFFNFINYMNIVDFNQKMSHNVEAVAKYLGKRFNLEDLENFLYKTAKIKFKLNLIEDMNGNKQLTVDYGHKKLDFFAVASAGTKALYEFYINTLLIKFKIDLNLLTLKGQLFENEINKLKMAKKNTSSKGINSLQKGINSLQKEFQNLQNEYQNILNGENFEKDENIQPTLPLIFIDDFDAFYHHALSKELVNRIKELNCQVILTTHNTTIMSNDLLRPDCYFIMDNNKIKPIHTFTKKELRKAHNIEKMYKAGAFNE